MEPGQGKSAAVKIRNTISCIIQNAFIQYAGMIANAIRTKWKFVVEFEDEETGEIAGTLGEAADRDECEVLIEEEMDISACAAISG